MALKDELKQRICIQRLTPNYTMASFKSWVEGKGIDKAMLLTWLNELQMELDIEAERYWQAADANAEHAALRSYWCLYCEQLRAYYRVISKHPECECDFWFLNY